MPKIPLWVVLLLNLPDAERNPPRRVRMQRHAAVTGNPYVAAAGRPAAPQPPPQDADAAPWQGAAAAPMRTRRWYVFLRGLAVAVMVLLLFLGVRQLFRNATSPAPAAVAPAELPPAATFPSAAAGGVAERFTRAYWSWDQDDPDRRAEALRLAGWAGDPSMGWNGKGKQVVTSPVSTVAIDPVSELQGSVTTVTEIETTVDGKAERRTVALRVPVTVTPSGIGVSGAPGEVAVPLPAAPGGRAIAAPDTSLTAETRPMAESFFQQYAADDDLTAIVAPGGSLRGLDGRVSFGRITQWQVAPPDRDTAQAVATVVWLGKDGAEQAQNYALTLQLATGGSTSRWQVLAIN